jgi:uncharacterized protein YdhG (YjbR/CyaY superfamily)
VEKSKKISKPEILYHFTSLVYLTAILRAGYLDLSGSNLNIGYGDSDVVWLTSSPNPMNHGLKFDDTIPTEYDKTSIRISLPYKPIYKHWDEWSGKKGMDKVFKASLIASARAEDTYKTWYISERRIPLSDFLKVENVVTGETIDVEATLKSLPDIEPKKIRFQCESDEYIFNQPANIQALLLEVRRIIREALPDATEKMSYSMPTYWQGRNLIHFAAQKNHLGIYPGADAMEHFAPRLSGYKTSKGAIQFPYKTFGNEQYEFIAEIAAWCGKERAKT